MRRFQRKVAVVTGAASGIGQALAQRFAAERMKVVLADVDSDTLAAGAAELQAAGAEILAVRADVGQYEEVVHLAQRTLETFGAVHILCNNAGVIDMADRPIWQTPLATLKWLMDVNVWGVIHGLHVFVPIMLKQGTAGHIVNTASIAGLLSNGHYGLYNATKHTVVALSETIHLALAEQQSEVRVSVLCPGFVNTRLVDAGRNRPVPSEAESAAVARQTRERIAAMRPVLQAAMSPAQVAEDVVRAIQEEKFYILPHPELKEGIQTRLENILEERNPEVEG